MKNLLRGVGFLTILLVMGCSSERAVTPLVTEPAAPNIQGVWQGMLTFTAYFDTDSLDFEYTRTRITFGDSSWQYYHMLPNGSVYFMYHCNPSESRYYVTDTSLHLRDACAYQTIYDGRIMYGDDYSLDLDGDRLVLRYSVYNPTMQAEVQQVVDLRRISD